MVEEDPSTGSPPRVRGKVQPLHEVAVRRGITPARAGKRLRHRPQCCMGRDHPRACGEKRRREPMVELERGSPPRVRGKVIAILLSQLLSGITPARAGKSLVLPGDCDPAGDHPRACGEKFGSGDARRRDEGSPPRVRGKAKKELTTTKKGRITPARAGKSPRQRTD